MSVFSFSWSIYLVFFPQNLSFQNAGVKYKVTNYETKNQVEKYLSFLPATLNL